MGNLDWKLVAGPPKVQQSSDALPMIRQKIGELDDLRGDRQWHEQVPAPSRAHLDVWGSDLLLIPSLTHVMEHAHRDGHTVELGPELAVVFCFVMLSWLQKGFLLHGSAFVEIRGHALICAICLIRFENGANLLLDLTSRAVGTRGPQRNLMAWETPLASVHKPCEWRLTPSMWGGHSTPSIFGAN